MFDPLQIPNVFRARSDGSFARRTLSTGFDALDAALVGGWPQPALIEILIDAYGIGELRMLLPLLRSLASTNSSPLIVWLNSPYLPNAVALEQSGVHATNWVSRDLSERDLLWVAEQCLRSHASSVVLAWSKAPSTAALRRLKLAAASTSTVGIVFRPLAEACQPSPATIRIALRPEHDRLRIDVIKFEGRKPAALSVDVSVRSQSAQLTS
jgi:protein ImuA